MDALKDAIRSNVRQYAMLLALIVITLFFQITTNGILLYPQNVANLIQQNAYVLILAVGMTLCILTGGNIDLSVGSICAFIGAVIGTFIINWKMPIAPAILLTLLVGALIGVWQGFWIAFVRIPPFIVTLAGMLTFRGLTLTILKGLTLSPYPAAFQFISAGFLGNNFVGFHISTVGVGVVLIAADIFFGIKARKKQRQYGFAVLPVSLFTAKIALISLGISLFTYWLASYKGIPMILLPIAFLIAVYSFFTAKTVPGRYIYAMGGNEKAARLSGIKTDIVLFLVYVNMAVLSAIAGIAFSSRLNASSPQAGQNFELDAIAACFIGGASSTGGVGTVFGAIIGALVMGVLNNGMSMMGAGTDKVMVVKGLVLLLAVGFDIMSKSRSKV
ncbi:MAG: sugar ABC transporter permease [Clostridiales bacterium]|jgi:putative multiple sugar transport system permease protein|nr:sugar ABC transporter permease [Clostridiales bacterium]